MTKKPVTFEEVQARMEFVRTKWTNPGSGFQFRFHYKRDVPCLLDYIETLKQELVRKQERIDFLEPYITYGKQA